MARFTLTQLQYRRLVDLMDSLPKLLTVAGRENLLEYAGLMQFAGDIEFASPRRDFSQQLVRRLQDYGTLNNEPALVPLLHELRDMVQGREEDIAFLEGLLSVKPLLSQRPEHIMRTIVPEANQGNQPMVFIAIDESLLTSARAVGQVSVPKISSGQIQRIPTGTGWLLTPSLMITCWHVIEARHPMYETITKDDLRDQIANTLVTFDYKRPGEGVEYKVVALEHYDCDLDYAVLRLEDRPSKPLYQRGFLTFDKDTPLTAQTQLFVIQHPMGQPQQRSGGFFKKYVTGNPNCILHSAPTETGTSGAPVLHINNGRVVALHKGENEGEQLREATLLSSILFDLTQRAPNVCSEIINAQKIKE